MWRAELGDVMAKVYDILFIIKFGKLVNKLVKATTFIILFDSEIGSVSGMKHRTGKKEVA